MDDLVEDSLRSQIPRASVKRWGGSQLASRRRDLAIGALGWRWLCEGSISAPLSRIGGARKLHVAPVEPSISRRLGSEKWSNDFRKSEPGPL